MWRFLLMFGLLAQPSRWPIATLTVEGNRNYTREQILAVAGLKVGQLAGKEAFEAARQRLEAAGVFETVGYRFAPAPGGKGYAASFQVIEAEPMYPVRFENVDVPDKEIETWLRARDPLFAPKLPATAAVLERLTRSVQEFLATRKHGEKIAAKLTPVGPDQFQIVIRPARAEPAVAQVRFQGNQVIPSAVLQNAISGVAIGMPYTEPAFREVLNNAIRPLYEARGRIRVSFPKIAVEEAKDVRGLAVQVTVEEGVSYDLGTVRMDNKSEVKSEDLVPAAGLKSGDIANFDDVAKGVEQIKKRLRRHGYMRSEATVERHVDDRKKTVDLTIHIEEGPQFTFGKLNIQGLDLHGEAAIRRLWNLKEGKPFNADYPEYFLEQVRERGLFDNLGKTRSAVKVDEQNRSVEVTLYFR